MREIKFRGWDGMKMHDHEEVMRVMYNLSTGSTLTRPLQYMQFTGLLDKNGKEIYEGDILCWPEYEGKKHQTRWAVEYNPLRGFCSWSPVGSEEIIGNIYENPELLK